MKFLIAGMGSATTGTINKIELNESLKRAVEVQKDISEWELSADGSHLKSKVTGIRVNDDNEIHLQYMTPEGEYETDDSESIPYEWNASNFLVELAKANNIERENFSDIINADIHIRKAGDSWKAKPPNNTTDNEISNHEFMKYLLVFLIVLIIVISLAGVVAL